MIGRRNVTKLTHDHSVIQDQIDRGLISEDNAELHNKQNVLLQCIGAGQMPIPQVERGELNGNITIIACSDGLWKTISEKEMFRALCPQMCVTSEDMLEQSKRLVDKAIERKEQDNITVAAMCLEF